jgi:hypothetical protein
MRKTLTVSVAKSIPLLETSTDMLPGGVAGKMQSTAVELTKKALTTSEPALRQDNDVEL